MNYPHYPEYKPSGVEWLGEVPGNWEVKRLKFAAACINDKQDQLPENSGYVAMEHIESWTGKRLDIENGITPESQTSRFQKDDVLFGKLRPYLAKSWLADRDGACSTELLVLRGRELNPAYLRYWTLTRPFIEVVDGSTYGSKMPRANWDFIGNMLTSIPARDEQRAIAGFLDRETASIDVLIEKKRRFIELLQEKRAALISRAVTRGLDPNVPLKDSGVEWLGLIPAHWEVKKGRFMGTLLGSVSPPEDDVIEDNDGTAYAKVDDLNFVDSSLLLAETKAKVRGLSAPRRKIILFPKRGAAIFTNKVVIADGVFLFDSNLMGWQIEPLHDTKFVAYCLLARRLDDLADVSTVPQINNKHIYPEKFPSPPLREQEVIVDYLDRETAKTDQMSAKVESAIEKLKEYRTALIAAAVTGKIDVRAT